jgi:putative chitinase
MAKWDRPFLFTTARIKIFGGHIDQSQVDGIEAIMKAVEAENVEDARHVAYILGTAFHECNETMQPVREAYWLGEDYRRRNLRYYPYYGRGFVQLTHRDNYKQAGEVFNVDLVNHPDEALKLDLAAKIIVRGMVEGWFCQGRRLSVYFNDTTTDWRGARRIVNGSDKAELIAGYAEKFFACLRTMVEQPVAPVQTPPVSEAPELPPMLETVPAGFWAAFMAFMAKWFGHPPL